VGSRSIGTEVLRFATFEVDLRSGELRKGGVKLKLGGQPFQVLAILLEQPGSIVTREDLQKRLWPDTFVDVDHNLNAAINRIREALSDSADTPRFIETLPRRGYRFIATLDDADSSNKALQTFTPTHSLEANARLLTRPVWAVVALLAATVTAGLFFLSHRPSSSGPRQRTLTRVTFEDGLQIGATWSPDGLYIAYASDHGGKFDIWVKQLGGGDPVKVTRTAGQNWQPDWSPDGKSIAYRSENADGGLFVIPALGGSGVERKISSFGYYPRWSPDGSRLLFQTGRYGVASKIFVVDLVESDAPREVLADVTSREFVISAAWHPDGKRISVWSLIEIPSPIPSFWTGYADSSKSSAAATKTEIAPEVLSVAKGIAGQGIGELADADSDFKLCWAPSGKAIYFERTFRGARNIWRMSMDPLSLRATAIERLTTGTELESEPALSPDATKLAFTTQPEQIRAWIFPFNADLGHVTGAGQPANSHAVEAWGGSLSPDGTKLAFAGRQAGKWALWIKAFAGGTEVRLPLDDTYVLDEPEWSPDGTQIAFTRMKPSTGELQSVIWNFKTQAEVPITSWGEYKIFVFDWSPDAQWLLASIFNPATNRYGLYKVRSTGVRSKEDVVQLLPDNPNYDLWQGHFSPDGDRIAFEGVRSVLTGFESSIFVAPASGGPWTRITDGKQWDDKPRWSPSGKLIYFISERGGFFNVFDIHFDSESGRPVGDVSQVTRFQSSAMIIARCIPFVGLSVSKSRLMATVSQSSGSIWVLDNVDR